MTISKALDVYSKIQNLHPTDVFTLADCVIDLLHAQGVIAAALLELDDARRLRPETRADLREFLGMRREP